MDLNTKKIMDRYRDAGRNASTRSSTTEETDAERWARLYNSTRGRGGCETCPDCMGRGDFAVVVDGQRMLRDCACRIRKQNLIRVRRSGLGELYEAYRLDNFETKTDWQLHLKEKAEAFLYADRGWMFVCGRSGSGKSHITCAVTRELLDAGRKVRYMLWREDAPKLKAMVTMPEEYEKQITELKETDVLVIDDFFKGRITDADVHLAFELLNARYNQPSKRTIISSEYSLEEILQRDEAVGSRIIERSRGYVLQTGDVNLRLAGATAEQ